VKAYAEIQDYGRLVGIVLTKQSDVPHFIQLARILGETSDDLILTSIEEQVAWSLPCRPDIPFRGQESIRLPIEEVQLIFDALYRAGMRPSNGEK
jgi:hypothetical protein